MTQRLENVPDGGISESLSNSKTSCHAESVHSEHDGLVLVVTGEAIFTLSTWKNRTFFMASAPRRAWECRGLAEASASHQHQERRERLSAWCCFLARLVCYSPHRRSSGRQTYTQPP